MGDCVGVCGFFKHCQSDNEKWRFTADCHSVSVASVKAACTGVGTES